MTLLNQVLYTHAHDPAIQLLVIYFTCVHGERVGRYLLQHCLWQQGNGGSLDFYHWDNGWINYVSGFMISTLYTLSHLFFKIALRQWDF